MVANQLACHGCRMVATFPPNAGTAALRRGRHSCAGQVYLLTFTTHRRQRHFADFHRACLAAKTMHDFQRRGGAKVLAWVLMPDHWHGLVELGDSVGLAKWVGQLKGSSAFALRMAMPGMDRIWADGFHDHALREDDDLVGCARYIVLNPVRAGLVTSLANYPIWNAVWLGDWVTSETQRG
jgi:REP element-mobilizing transposase RayT